MKKTETLAEIISGEPPPHPIKTIQESEVDVIGVNGFRSRLWHRVKPYIISGLATLGGLGFLNSFLAVKGYNQTTYTKRIELFVEDSRYGFSLNPTNPNIRGPYGCVSSQGYKGKEDISRTRPANELMRILALGDSIFFAFFGKDAALEAGVCEVLEKMITDEIKQNDTAGYCKIINTSVPCWGPAQYILRYDLEGRFFDPDLVLIELCPNDVTDSYNYSMLRIAKDDFMRRAYLNAQTCGGGVRFDEGFLGRIRRRLSGVPLFIFVQKELLDRQQKIAERNRANLLGSISPENLFAPYARDLQQLIENIPKSKLLFVVYPSGKPFGLMNHIPDMFSFPYEDMFRTETTTFLKSNGLPYIDVLELYRAYLRNNPTCSSKALFPAINGAVDPIHPSILAHQLCAEAILNFYNSRYPNLFSTEQIIH